MWNCLVNCCYILQWVDELIFPTVSSASVYLACYPEMGPQPLMFRATAHGTYLVLDINVHTAPLFGFPILNPKTFILLDIMDNKSPWQFLPIIVPGSWLELPWPLSDAGVSPRATSWSSWDDISTFYPFSLFQRHIPEETTRILFILVWMEDNTWMCQLS